MTASPGTDIAGAFIWHQTYLDDLDGFVFKARPFLDFSNASYDDGLKSILERNRRSALLVTWAGKVPLRVVLTKGNRFFKST
jgi:hypothetical protein